MEWKEYKLGDFCTFQEGYVNPPQTNHEYFDGDVKWVRAVDLNNAKVYDTTRKLTQKGFLSAKKSAVLFEPNTIVISKSGTIGRLGLIQDYMCGNRATINIKPLPNTNINYIFYLLLNNQEEIANQAVGSVQKNLYVSILENMRFKFPSLEDQKRIADILSSLDAKIENNNKINAKLEEMAQALFKSWFIDFEPFKVGRDGSRPAFGSGNFVESELGMIPEGWKVGKLGDLIKTTSGGTPSRKIESFYEKGTICWVKSKELAGSFIIDTEEKITNEAVEKSSAKKLPEFSVLIAMYGATVGEYAIIDKEMTCNQAICALLPNDDIPYSFLYMLAKNKKEDLINKAVGSAQQNISQVIVKDLDIVYDLSIIRRFHQIVKPIFNKILGIIKENRNLAQTRDTLLPKLMSGEIEL